MSETENELMKSEKQKDSELQTAKTLYEEANERLAQAIQNKNFNEAAVAQGLLEVAKKKMDNAMDQSKLCSNKRTEPDKSKKETVGGLLQTCVYQEEKGQSLNVEDLLL